MHFTQLVSLGNPSLGCCLFQGTLCNYVISTRWLSYPLQYPSFINWIPSYIFTRTHLRKQLPMSKNLSLHASSSCRKYLQRKRIDTQHMHSYWEENRTLLFISCISLQAVRAYNIKRLTTGLALLGHDSYLL